MQKDVNLVDLIKSFPTNIFLQNLASIQKRTSPIKFDHLAEKSEEGSVSNLSTKGRAEVLAALPVAMRPHDVLFADVHLARQRVAQAAAQEAPGRLREAEGQALVEGQHLS